MIGERVLFARLRVVVTTAFPGGHRLATSKKDPIPPTPGTNLTVQYLLRARITAAECTLGGLDGVVALRRVASGPTYILEFAANLGAGRCFIQRPDIGPCFVITHVCLKVFSCQQAITLLPNYRW